MHMRGYILCFRYTFKHLYIGYYTVGYHWRSMLNTRHPSCKVTMYSSPKKNILSLFTHLHVILNLYKCISCVLSRTLLSSKNGKNVNRMNSPYYVSNLLKVYSCVRNRLIIYSHYSLINLNSELNSHLWKKTTSLLTNQVN